MRIADRVAEYLAGINVTHAFGIVGGGNIHLWDALSKRLNVVSVHHEQAACMAATAYYRTCGRLAPAIVTTGAGSTNALTGVMAAFMDSIPLLVLSGNEASYHLVQPFRVRGVQGYRSDVVAETMTKRALSVHNAGIVLDVLEELIATALAPRQGPVWGDIPKDIQNAMG